MPALEADLEAERHHLAASRQALKRMRQPAEDLFATGDRVAGDAYAAETLGRHLAKRIAELADNPDTPLFFGRLDIDDDRFHVGRRHVTDTAGEPMVLDWRAPISRKFYQASVKDPQDVTTRRRFGFVKGELTSFEDEHLQAGEDIGTSRILLEEIERPASDRCATSSPPSNPNRTSWSAPRSRTRSACRERPAPGTPTPEIGTLPTQSSARRSGRPHAGPALGTAGHASELLELRYRRYHGAGGGAR